MRFRITISRLTVVCGLVIGAAFVGVEAANMTALDELKIGGPISTQLDLSNELTADILPPPEYVIEPYLVASLALNDRKNLSSYQAQFKQLRHDYEDRKQYWSTKNIDSGVKAALFQGSAPLADKFWQLTETQFLPALVSGDDKAAHAAFDQMTTVYGQHRTAILALVDKAARVNTGIVASAHDTSVFYNRVAWGVNILVLLFLVAGIAGVLMALAKPIVKLTAAMMALSGGDLDAAVPCAGRKDEIGELAGAMAVFKDQLNAAERAKTEQNHMIGLVGDSLSLLANGDLTHRASPELTGAFAKLKDDFNGALTRLQDTMKNVLTSTSGISTGAGEIAQAADDLSRRTEQNAASLEQTAAALEEITATVKKTAQNAREANRIVTGTRTAAEEGGHVVQTAITAMGQIEQSSKKITDIIGVIDEIAFQTNLLALNAGVEAARAGDAGKGFAVVASEVRALAQRSSEAAREIKTLIKTSGEQVNSGVKLVDESGKALKRIVEQVVQIDVLVTEMAQAAQQQSTGIEEVNVAVSQMDQVTQQNAAMVEQSTAASRNLATETNELSDIVSHFNVGADPAARKTPEPVSPAGRTAPRAVPSVALKSGGSGGRRAVTALAMRAAPDAEDWQEF